jgi:hypothetical protein
MLDMAYFIEGFQKELNEQCSQYDKQWLVRKRVFNSELLLCSIISLALEGTGASYRLLKGLFRVQNQIPGLCTLPAFAASSFSTARKKLSPFIFVDLSQWIYRFFINEFKGEKWFGRDIYALDAAKIIVPKALENEGFDDMGSGSFYPMAMFSALFDVRLGLVYDSVLSQHADEQFAAESLISSMNEGAVVICDRGYFSYRFIQLLKEAKVDFIIRLSKASAPEEIREFFEEQNRDEIVSISPSLPSERKIIRQGRQVGPMDLRVVTDFRQHEPIVLLTSLFESEIKAKDIRESYKLRWDIEEHFKIFKGNFLGEKFRSRNLNGVLQEIFAATLILNIVQAMTLTEVGQKQKTVQRKFPSPSLVVGIIRKVLPILMRIPKSLLSSWLQIVKAQIHESMSSFRAKRSYERVSHRPIGRWAPKAEGVRC